MAPIQFTRDQARTMLVLAQGLFLPTAEKITADDVEACIQRMGVLQIDTIHVVARSPYLVLWSRLGDYDPNLVEELLSTRRIFEYWSHEACFIPISDYRLYRVFMLEQFRHARRFEWLNQNPAASEAMLAHVQANGPVRSSDFERTDDVKGNWWNWKDEKRALDYLHAAGDLMIVTRDKFRRIYDLRERIHPDWNDAYMLPYEEVVETLIEKTVKSLGVACASWCADYYRLPVKDTLAALKRLVEKETIRPAKIDEFKDPAYVHIDHLNLTDEVRQGRTAEGSTLLSPFDPVVWDRKRALQLFDFDYRIECYTPEPKRKYGYFSLPILIDNRIVGRLDAKAHRKDKIFEVKAIFLEPGVEIDDPLLANIGSAVQRCAEWHKTPNVKVTKADRPKLARSVQAAAKASKTKAR